MRNFFATKSGPFMWKSRRIRLAVCLIVGVASVFAFWEMRRRSLTYSEAAGHYSHYARSYADAPDHMYISCYGVRWDTYMETLVEDVKARRDDLPYRASRAAHFRKLQGKYTTAAQRPWLPVTLDPPLNSP